MRRRRLWGVGERSCNTGGRVLFTRSEVLKIKCSVYTHIHTHTAAAAAAAVGVSWSNTHTLPHSKVARAHFIRVSALRSVILMSSSSSDAMVDAPEASSSAAASSSPASTPEYVPPKLDFKRVFAANQKVARSFGDLTAMTVHGQSLPMKNLSGQVILVVNVASKCAFAPQLEAMETLYQAHKAKGFAILAFPCADFGATPAEKPAAGTGAAGAGTSAASEAIVDTTEKDLQALWTEKNLTFPLMAKVSVNPTDAEIEAFTKVYTDPNRAKGQPIAPPEPVEEAESPVFTYLKEKRKAIAGRTAIQWNFEKFLIDREGKVVKRYGCQVTVDKIEKDIETLLKNEPIEAH
jgi:glutathione peroxidase-family protein